MYIDLFNERQYMQILMSNYLVLIAIWCLILSTYIVLISRKEKSLEVREKRKVQSVIYFISLGLLVFDLLTFRFAGHGYFLFNNDYIYRQYDEGVGRLVGYEKRSDSVRVSC